MVFHHIISGGLILAINDARSITPSRQLSLQRAYRDRRATYVAELEARLRDIEEENKQLKAEVKQLRSALKELVSECARTSGYDVVRRQTHSNVNLERLTRYIAGTSYSRSTAEASRCIGQLSELPEFCAWSTCQFTGKYNQFKQYGELIGETL